MYLHSLLTAGAVIFAPLLGKNVDRIFVAAAFETNVSADRGKGSGGGTGGRGQAAELLFNHLQGNDGTGFVMEGDKLDSPSTTNKVATTNTEDCVGENGGHCTFTSNCCEGLACEGFVPFRKCLPKLDDRAACDEDNDCMSGSCWNGYCWCAATNTKKGGGLRPKQLRGEKEENDVEMSDGNSNTPLEAGFLPGPCVKENGGHCTFTSGCCEGLRCDGFIPNRTCLPKLDSKGQCDEDNDCKSSECWNGYCWC